jgi:CheY-like chemotaxis protein
MSGQPRALVAEDSITARIFLTRLLEREGFAVRAVSSAPELFDELVDESWSLICVDVDLPDGADKAVLGAVIERLKGRRSSTPAVALVRDAYDIAFARAVGATRTLSKPFDPAALQELLALLGFGPPKAR